MKSSFLSKPHPFAVGLTAILGMAASVELKAADVSVYGVIKRQNFVQLAPGATAANPLKPFEGALFADVDDFGAINSISVSEPGNASTPLPDFEGFQVVESFPSAAALTARFPAGQYTFLFDTANDGLKAPVLSVPGDAFPQAPVISNFQAAQSLGVGADFSVTWNTLPGGTAGDFVQLRVNDDAGNEVFSTPSFGEADALTGTSTSGVIPAGTLDAGQNYRGLLTYARVAGANLAGYPGAIGVVAFAAETEFPIVAAAGAGGPGGGVGPTLLFTNPQNGATSVPSQSPVIFAFSTPMVQAQSISWTGNGLDATKFVYNWIQPTVLTVTYTGGFPAGTQIGYTLNPAGSSGFKDTSGNPLATTTGSFTVAGTSGGGPGNPCDPGNPGTSSGGVYVFKSLNFVQSGQSAPVLDPDGGAFFAASVSAPTSNPVTGASLQVPGGARIPLTQLFGGAFNLVRQYQTAAQMDAEIPNGTYVLTVNRQNGATHTFNIVLQGDVPIPQIANLAELNAFNSAADNTVRWLPFTGATTDKDFISFSLMDEKNVVFDAPNQCVPRSLKVTDTSILVPKNTLAATGEIDGNLTFSKSITVDNSVPDLPASSGVARSTSFTLRTSGTPPTGTGPKFVNPTVAPDNTLTGQITGQAGGTYQIQVSQDLVVWTTISTVTLPASGALPISVPITGAKGFMRARTP